MAAGRSSGLIADLDTGTIGIAMTTAAMEIASEMSLSVSG
jgi:hypothetical protein